MISATKYLRPNITIESEIVDSKKFYVYNYKGLHYRVFCSLMSLREFLLTGYKTWIYDCYTESELDKYLYGSAQVN